jgi:hypothetical protein
VFYPLTFTLKKMKFMGLKVEKRFVKLYPGEVECDRCDGTGFRPPKSEDGETFARICPKCCGEGKLDWLENICGKKDDPFIKRIERLEKGIRRSFELDRRLL